MINLAVFGSPGAGKGTQAQLIAKKLAIPHISTGDLFRYNIENNTELGLSAKSYMDKGELVPSAVTNEMVKDRLSKEDALNGFILDGYPRSLEQAETLTGLLAEARKLNHVLFFEVPEEVVLERMLLRGRADDNEEVIKNRLDVYQKQTLPILDYYQGILINIDAVGTVEEVFSRICTALNL